MTQNALQIGSEALTVLIGAIVLFVFAVLLIMPQRAQTRPGSKGHRPPEDDIGHEEVRPDGFIDSFAGEIEEAGGGLPLLVKLALPGVLLWWLIYLVLNWTPR